MATMVLEAIRAMSGNLTKAAVEAKLNEAFAKDPHISSAKARDSEGLSPLMLAVQTGNYYAVEWLFKKEGHNPRLDLVHAVTKMTALEYGVCYEDVEENASEEKSSTEAPPLSPSKQSESYQIGSMEARRKILQKLLNENAKNKKTTKRTDDTMDRTFGVLALCHNNQHYLQMRRYSKAYVIYKISEAYANNADVVLNQEEFLEFKRAMPVTKYSYAFLDELSRNIKAKNAKLFEKSLPDLLNPLCSAIETESKTFMPLYVNAVVRIVITKRGIIERLSLSHFVPVQQGKNKYYQEVTLPAPMKGTSLVMAARATLESSLAAVTYLDLYWANKKINDEYKNTFVSKLTTMTEQEVDQLFIIPVRRDDQDQTPMVSFYENLDMLSSELVWEKANATLLSLVQHLTQAHKSLFAFAKFFTPQKHVDKFGELAMDNILQQLTQLDTNAKEEKRLGEIRPILQGNKFDESLHERAAREVTRFSGDLSGDIYRRDVAKRIAELSGLPVLGILNREQLQQEEKKLESAIVSRNEKIAETQQKFKILSSKIPLNEQHHGKILGLLIDGNELIYKELSIVEKNAVLDYLLNNDSSYSGLQLYIRKSTELGQGVDKLIQEKDVIVISELIRDHQLPEMKDVSLTDEQIERLALQIGQPVVGNFFSVLSTEAKNKVLDDVLKHIAEIKNAGPKYLDYSIALGRPLGAFFQTQPIVYLGELVTSKSLPSSTPIQLTEDQLTEVAKHLTKNKAVLALYEALPDKDKMTVLDLMVTNKVINSSQSLLFYISLAKKIPKSTENIFADDHLKEFISQILFTNGSDFNPEFLTIEPNRQLVIINDAIAKLTSSTQLPKPQELYPLLSRLPFNEVPTPNLSKGLVILGTFLLTNYLTRLNAITENEAKAFEMPAPEVKLPTHEEKTTSLQKFDLSEERREFETFFAKLAVSEKVAILDSFLQNNIPPSQIGFVLSLLDEALLNNRQIDAGLRRLAAYSLKHQQEDLYQVFNTLHLPTAKEIITAYIIDNLSAQAKLPAVTVLMSRLQIDDYQSLFSESEEKATNGFVDDFMALVEKQKPSLFYQDIVLALVNKNKIKLNTYEPEAQKKLLKQIYAMGNIDQFKIFIQNKPYELSKLELESKMASEYSEDGKERIDKLLAAIRILEKPELAFTTTAQKLEVFNQVDVEDRAALRVYFMGTKHREFIQANFQETSGEQQTSEQDQRGARAQPSAPSNPPQPSAPVIDKRGNEHSEKDPIVFTNQGQIEYLSVNVIASLLDSGKTGDAHKGAGNADDEKVAEVNAKEDVDAEPGMEGVPNVNVAPGEHEGEGIPNPARAEQPVTAFLSELNALWQKLPKDLQKDPRIVKAMHELPESNKPAHKRTKSG